VPASARRVKIAAGIRRRMDLGYCIGSKSIVREPSREGQGQAGSFDLRRIRSLGPELQIPAKRAVSASKPVSFRQAVLPPAEVKTGAWGPTQSTFSNPGRLSPSQNP
jgi:hypothetical protein